MEQDTYTMPALRSAESLYKEKGSKFIGIVFPVTSEDEVKSIVADIRKEHFSARHWCYAYRLGPLGDKYRVNDDGEPSNSAGMPIYGQILASGHTNVLVVVIRYYGGVKLGVGGLVNAYKIAAKEALEMTEAEEHTIDDIYELGFAYKDMSKVMRLIKEHHAKMLSQDFDIHSKIQISVRKSQSEKFAESVRQMYEITLKKQD